MQLPRMCRQTLRNYYLRQADLPLVNYVWISFQCIYNIGEQFETPRTSKHHLYIAYFHAVGFTETALEIEWQFAHIGLRKRNPFVGYFDTGKIGVLKESVVGVFIFASEKLCNAFSCVVTPCFGQYDLATLQQCYMALVFELDSAFDILGT